MFAALLGWMAWHSSLADSDHDAARTLVEAGEILPLEAILSKAQGEYAGRVLEVELESKGRRRIYEIELIDEQGVVRELEYDAHSGELLRVKQDD
ncbi:MAG: hypothetical protein AMJ69_08245 [Gammaproteobacteria bacterium SG8_47]|nr:MAG: hypothetical protein AMJ69_08245 [Gammaproteobacteria bacterium SG8_47]